MKNSYLLSLTTPGQKTTYSAFDKLILQEAKERLASFKVEFESVLAKNKQQLSKAEIVEVLSLLQPEDLPLLNARENLYKALIKHQNNQFDETEKDFIELMLLSTKLKIVNEEINNKMPSRNEEGKKFENILKPIREKSRDKEIEHLIPRLIAATEEYKNDLEKDMLKIAKKVNLSLEQLEQEIAKLPQDRNHPLQQLIEKQHKIKLTIEKYSVAKDSHGILSSQLPATDKFEQFCQKIEENKELLETHRDSSTKRFLGFIGQALLFVYSGPIRTPIPATSEH